MVFLCLLSFFPERSFRTVWMKSDEAQMIDLKTVIRLTLLRFFFAYFLFSQKESRHGGGTYKYLV